MSEREDFPKLNGRVHTVEHVTMVDGKLVCSDITDQMNQSYSTEEVVEMDHESILTQNVSEIYELNPKSVLETIRTIKSLQDKGCSDRDVYGAFKEEELQQVVVSEDGKVIDARNVFALNYLFEGTKDSFIV